MKIYKYFPPISPSYPHFLSSLQIRFTQPIALNDPYECMPYIINCGDPTFITNKMNNLAHIAKKYVGSQIGGNSKGQAIDNEKTKMTSSFINNPKQLEQIYLNAYLKRLNINVGVLSLSEAGASPVMWAHYSKDHKGFVVCFNSENDFFKQQIGDTKDIGYLKSVEYDNTRITIDFQKSIIPIELWFRKSTDWSYEKELRIIRSLSNANKAVNSKPYPIHLFDVPASAIMEVCLGMDMDKRDEQQILLSVKSNKALSHVKIFKAALNDKSFNMDWKPM